MRAAAMAFAVLAVLAVSATVAVAQAAWKTVEIDTADMYTTRSDCAFGRCGDKLCLLGGRDTGTPKPANIFDTRDLKWGEASGAPEGIHHWQLAADPADEDGDCIWAGGAFLGYYPREQLATKIYKFCSGNKKWSDGPDIDRPRGAGGAVTYKGKYYLVGGNVGGHGPHSEVKAWLDEYDPKTKKWKILADIPHPRDHFFAAVLKDKLYVAGGRNGTAKDFFAATTSEVDVYDFAMGTWTTLGTPFPIASGGNLVGLHGDRIMYAGGEGNQTDAFSNMYFFDGVTFTAGPDLLTPRHGAGFASCSGALWTAGGVSQQGGEPEISTTEVYLVGTDVPACVKKGYESPDTTQSGLLAAETTGGKDDGDGATNTETVSAENGRKCFPANARVELDSGVTVSVSQLRHGDRVRVSASEFSHVYFFSHRDPAAETEFVNIVTADESASVTLSPGHLLPVNGKLTPARDVVEGDSVSVIVRRGGGISSEVVRVLSVSKRVAKGLYNPHTIHGDVVVDGVVTSCLTDALHPQMASAALAPLKSAFLCASSLSMPMACALAENVNSVVLVGLGRLGAWGDGTMSRVWSFIMAQFSAKSEL